MPWQHDIESGEIPVARRPNQANLYWNFHMEWVGAFNSNALEEGQDESL